MLFEFHYKKEKNGRILQSLIYVLLYYMCNENNKPGGVIFKSLKCASLHFSKSAKHLKTQKYKFINKSLCIIFKNKTNKAVEVFLATLQVLESFKFIVFISMLCNKRTSSQHNKVLLLYVHDFSC